MSCFQRIRFGLVDSFLFLSINDSIVVGMSVLFGLLWHTVERTTACRERRNKVRNYRENKEEKKRIRKRRGRGKKRVSLVSSTEIFLPYNTSFHFESKLTLRDDCKLQIHDDQFVRQPELRDLHLNRHRFSISPSEFQ